MKYLAILSLCFFFFACGEERQKPDEKSANKETETKEDSTAVEEVSLPPAELNEEWIINISATADQQEAAKEVQKLMEQDPKNKYGYLWIPDYKSLSGKELYVIFQGPYGYMDAIMPALIDYQKSNPKAYAIKVSKEKEDRKAIYGKFDIRSNKKKNNIVLIYATPEDEKDYTGEDWGFFVNDVSEFMHNEAEDIYSGTLYRSWYSEKDIQKIEEELKPEGFGYICIKPNGDKLFIQHDMPGSVIGQMCAFFGYGCEEN